MQAIPGKTGDIEPEVKIPGLLILVDCRIREDGFKLGAARIVIGEHKNDFGAVIRVQFDHGFAGALVEIEQPKLVELVELRFHRLQQAGVARKVGDERVHILEVLDHAGCTRQGAIGVFHFDKGRLAIAAFFALICQPADGQQIEACPQSGVGKFDVGDEVFGFVGDGRVVVLAGYQLLEFALRLGVCGEVEVHGLLEQGECIHPLAGIRRGFEGAGKDKKALP